MFGGAPKDFTLSDFPEPEIIDPASVPALRWGILGAGDIAEVFADTVRSNTTQQIVAAASRTPGKSERFAERFDIPRH